MINYPQFTVNFFGESVVVAGTIYQNGHVTASGANNSLDYDSVLMVVDDSDYSYLTSPELTGIRVLVVREEDIAKAKHKQEV